MCEGITITFLGHACFRLTYRGFSLVLDPYDASGLPGMRPLCVQADAVLCSHGHYDHAYTRAVTLSGTAAKSPFSVSAIECPHDDAGGAKRGMNKIHILEAGGLRAAHFGDIGCGLTDAQARALSGLDAAMLPVGGFYTIDAAQADAICRRIAPTVVIPMHYRTERAGLPEIATVEPFLALRRDAVRHESDSLLLTKGMKRQTAVLRQK